MLTGIGSKQESTSIRERRRVKISKDSLQRIRILYVSYFVIIRLAIRRHYSWSLGLSQKHCFLSIFCHVSQCDRIRKHFCTNACTWQIPRKQYISCAANVWNNSETYENIPMFFLLGTFLLHGKRILFPQQCFPRWANYWQTLETRFRNNAFQFVQAMFYVSAYLWSLWFLLVDKYWDSPQIVLQL